MNKMGSSSYGAGDCGGSHGDYHALVSETKSQKLVARQPGLVSRAGASIKSGARKVGKFLGKHKGKIAAGALALGAAHLANKSLRKKYGIGLGSLTKMAASNLKESALRKASGSNLGKRVKDAAHKAVMGTVSTYSKNQSRKVNSEYRNTGVGFKSPWAKGATAIVKGKK